MKEKNKILAEGEATGHMHRFESPQALVFADSNGNQFVDLKEKSSLIHEEHSQIAVPKGKYKVVIQREVDLLGKVRQVMD